MRTLAVTNQKGGCGKTTISINLAACLAELDRLVLLLDMDPQAHCALGLAVPEERVEISIADVLLADGGQQPIEIDQAVWQINRNFDLVPATAKLAELGSALARNAPAHLCLRSALHAVASRYDYCIIDCPAQTDVLTYNALGAADHAIIPVETGFFSLQGLSRQLRFVEDFKAETAADVKIHILANGYDVRTKLARELLSEMRAKYQPLMFRSHINFNTKLKEGASLGQPITEYDSSSMGYRDFTRLAAEIVEMEQHDGVSEELLLQAHKLAEGVEGLLAGRSALAAAARSQAATERPPAATARGTSVKPIGPDAHRQIQERIDQIYGVRQTPDGVEFNVNIPGAREVSIVGDFNDWSPHRTPMSRQGENGHFRAVLPLPKGRFRYRLLVDGRWTRDPCNERTEVNEVGGVDSVVEIR